MRRMFFSRFLALILCTVFALTVSAESTAKMRVTLLGTGTPTPDPNRSGAAVLIEKGDVRLLFDAGRNVVTRLQQAGLRLGNLDAVFLTHLHSDHVSALPDLMLSSRLPADYGLRTRPLALYGPSGTVALARGIETAFSADIDIRYFSQQLPVESSRFLASEFAEGGVVYEQSGVRVTAFPVDHGDGFVGTAFGYRIDIGQHAVVISGDTTYTEEIVRVAKGADLLIHEVAYIRPEYVKQFPRMLKVISIHTTPQQAGTIFTLATPKLAVLTHLALIGGSTLPELVAAIQETYSGPLIVGEDLMTFEIGDGIAVYQRSGSTAKR